MGGIVAIKWSSDLMGGGSQLGKWPCSLYNVKAGEGALIGHAANFKMYLPKFQINFFKLQNVQKSICPNCNICIILLHLYKAKDQIIIELRIC